MKRFVYEAGDEAATAALGAALAEILPDGATVALSARSGRARRGWCRRSPRRPASTAAASSAPPSSSSRNTPAAAGSYHIDAYRLRGEDEFRDLGPDEYFEGGALVLVEWADRVENCLPRERIEIHIAATGPQSRRFEIRAVGPRHAGAIEALAARLRPKP